MEFLAQLGIGLLGLIIVISFVRSIFNPKQTGKSNEKYILLSTGRTINQSMMSSFDLSETFEYKFIYNNLSNYPNYKKYRVGDEVSSIEYLNHFGIDKNSWKSKEAVLLYERDLNNLFNSLFSNYEKVIEEYKLFTAYIKNIEAPKIEADNKRKLELEIAERKAKEKREQEEYLKNIQQKQADALKSLILNRKLELYEIKSTMKFGGVYIIKNIKNNNLYVGSTVSFGKRMQLHLNNLKLKKHHSHLLQNEFDKYGEVNFKFYIIESVPQIIWQTRNCKDDNEEVQKQKYKKYLKAIEANLFQRLNPYYNIDDDSRGSRHWINNSKYNS